MTSPPSQPPANPKRPASLRRVLAGYLRLRSPYNLCIDACIVLVVSYAGQAIQDWLGLAARARRGPTELVTSWWAVNQAATIAIGILYLAAMGMFFIGCARIIADRVGAERL